MGKKLFSNTITLPAPFQANSPDPVDARYVVEFKADLFNGETFGTSGDYTFVHPGMQVYVCEDECVYTYVGEFDNYGVPTENLTEENWRKEVLPSDIPSPEGEIADIKEELDNTQTAVFGTDMGKDFDDTTELYSDNYILSGSSNMIDADKTLASFMEDSNRVVAESLNDLNSRLRKGSVTVNSPKNTIEVNMFKSFNGTLFSIDTVYNSSLYEHNEELSGCTSQDEINLKLQDLIGDGFDASDFDNDYILSGTTSFTENDRRLSNAIIDNEETLSNALTFLYNKIENLERRISELEEGA